MRTILFHQTGPMIQYEAGVLHIKDLNPEAHLRWRLSRGELVKLAMRALLSAVRG
jgi:hypothetical protein